MRSLDHNLNGECVYCGKKITILVKTHWGICDKCAVERGWKERKR
jgi:hypothetical protein